MIKQFTRKTGSFGLRSALALTCAAFLSLGVTAPANARYFAGGHFAPHYYPHYWGPGIAFGVGFGCCWGPSWGYWPGYYYPSYPYPYASPYVSYPITDGADVALASPYVQQALAAPVGNTISWGNGATHGDVTTVRDGWAGANYCRQFRQNMMVDGKEQVLLNTACRPPNGSWHLVPNQ